MALDESTSHLIRMIYAGAYDVRSWDGAIEQIVRRTGSRFAFVAALDTKAHAFPSTKFYGVDEGRFWDGVAEYEQHQYRLDPAVPYTAKHKNGRLFEKRGVHSPAQ